MPIQETDWLLGTLLDGVSAQQSSIELTLFAGGLAFSGTAISEEVYFERIGLPSALESIVETRLSDALEQKELLAEMGNPDLSRERRRELRLRLAELDRQFVLMVDVTIFGAGPAPLQADAWRGRLSEISGWVFGRYSTGVPTDQG